MSDLGPHDLPFSDMQRDALLLEMHGQLQRIDDRSAQADRRLTTLERAREQHSKDIAGFQADRERAKWWSRAFGAAAITACIGWMMNFFAGKN